MRSILIALVALFTLAGAASAQTPIVIGPNSTLAWEIAAPDVATARTFTYAATVDTSAPITLNPVNCGPGPSGTSGVFTCSTPVAQIPTGSHSITVTATSNGVTSLPSAPFAYIDLLIPVPTNLRIK